MLELLGLQLSALMAGFCGSTVYLVVSPPMGAFKMFTSVSASVLCAGYLAPIMAELTNLQSRSLVGIAFFVGLSTMSAVPGLLKTIETTASDPFHVLKKWKGK